MRSVMLCLMRKLATRHSVSYARLSLHMPCGVNIDLVFGLTGEVEVIIEVCLLFGAKKLQMQSSICQSVTC